MKVTDVVHHLGMVALAVEEGIVHLMENGVLLAEHIEVAEVVI
ncbi:MULTISPECIES: hypothetical protein [unclassified Ruminococcus]|nr:MULTISPECIES: hypothetical protein [unclassified Ruminococcus]